MAGGQGGAAAAIGNMNKQTPTAATGGTGPQITSTDATAPASEQGADDPACEKASALLIYLSTFYEFLGGDSGTINWAKFEDGDSNSAESAGQGISWLLGTLKGQKTKVISGTEAATKVEEANANALTVRIPPKELMITRILLTFFFRWQKLSKRPVKSKEKWMRKKLPRPRSSSGRTILKPHVIHA